MIDNLISVITPAYNSCEYIVDAINSVRAQSYPNWEMIIVDDASTDRTLEIIRNIASHDGRIKIIGNAVNSGKPSVARNVALSVARGRYVAFLDSDDMWMPDKLLVQMEYMTKNNIGFTFSQYRSVSSDGKRLGKLIRVPPILNYGDALYNAGCIGCLTVMLDLKMTGQIKFNDIGHEDYGLWLTILKSGVIAHGINYDLARYRMCRNSISTNKLKAATWVWKIFRTKENLGLFRSIVFFVFYVARSAKKRMLNYET